MRPSKAVAKQTHVERETWKEAQSAMIPLLCRHLGLPRARLAGYRPRRRGPPTVYHEAPLLVGISHVCSVSICLDCVACSCRFSAKVIQTPHQRAEVAQAYSPEWPATHRFPMWKFKDRVYVYYLYVFVMYSTIRL